MTNKVHYDLTHDGQIARITLATPKANILDRVTMVEIMKSLHILGGYNTLKAIVLESEGPHFSFGASIAEHLPDEIEQTLILLRSLLDSLSMAKAPTIAAVRGQCLGGAFELVLACDLIIADETAQFALPEIKLGVFPPAGAALLPVRIGASTSSEMVITGNAWNASAARAAGLVHRLAPAGKLDISLDEWLESDFLPRSAVALRCAAQAARRPVVCALKNDLPGLEHMYLDQLMSHPDATEGIRAFMEKRQPQWSMQREIAQTS